MIGLLALVEQLYTKIAHNYATQAAHTIGRAASFGRWERRVFVCNLGAINFQTNRAMN